MTGRGSLIQVSQVATVRIRERGGGVELCGEQGVEAGCFVGQTVEKAKRAGRVVERSNKAADAGSLIVICFLYPPIDSKSGLLRSG
jgi:hypothetical protein